MTNNVQTVPIHEKLSLTIREAAEYSNIGINKIDEMLRTPNCPFVLFVGKKKLVKRKEFEEFISSSGYKALYPGAFGSPKEDVNCRCCILQRAKWAMTDREFTKMNGETNELQHFENVDDYNKFKELFWEVTK